MADFNTLLNPTRASMLRMAGWRPDMMAPSPPDTTQATGGWSPISRGRYDTLASMANAHPWDPQDLNNFIFQQADSLNMTVPHQVLAAMAQQESSGGKANARYEPRLQDASFGPLHLLARTAYQTMGYQGSMEELASNPHVSVPLALQYLQRQVDSKGLQGGVAAYNGSGPAAQQYAQSVLGKSYSPLEAQYGSLESLTGLGNLGATAADALRTAQAGLQSNLDQATASVADKRKALEDAWNRPLRPEEINHFTKLPMPYQPSSNQEFFSGLLGNIGSAISGNPAYAAQANARSMDARLAARDVAQRNALMERSEEMDARDRVVQQASHDLATEQQRQGAIQSVMDAWPHTVASATIGAATSEEHVLGTVQSALYRKGLRINDKGEVEQVTGTSNYAMEEKDYQANLGRVTDNLRDYSAKNQKLIDAAMKGDQNAQRQVGPQMQAMSVDYLRALGAPRKGEDFQTVYSRVVNTNRLPNGFPISPQVKLSYIKEMALERARTDGDKDAADFLMQSAAQALQDTVGIQVPTKASDLKKVRKLPTLTESGAVVPMGGADYGPRLFGPSSNAPSDHTAGGYR